jgi:hypothetical protein
MEPPVTAVYDANILDPEPLRDLFIRIARGLRSYPKRPMRNLVSPRNRVCEPVLAHEIPGFSEKPGL